MAGLTSSGFEIKSTDEIVTELGDDTHAIVDPTLDVDESTPLGQLWGIVASKLSELWLVGQALSTANDPEQATGYALDGLLTLTGVKRLGATSSTVPIQFSSSAPVFVPAGTVIVPSADDTYRWVTLEDTNIPAGDTLITAAAEQTGPLTAVPGLLDTLLVPIPNVTAVENLSAASPGRNIETDMEARVRRTQSLAASGNATVDAIRANLIALEGMESVTVIENSTMFTDVLGNPPKSFQAIVYDGVVPALTDDEIAQVIWDSKPAGIEAYGSSSGTAEDALGTSRTVAFSRPTGVPIYFVVEVQRDPTTYPGSQAVKDAIVAAGRAGRLVGDDVVALKVKAAPLSVLGVYDVTGFTLGTAPAPVGTANVTITFNELATFDTANITVTEIP